MTPKYFGLMFLGCIGAWTIGRFVFLTYEIINVGVRSPSTYGC
jgi:hypothetical protein